MASCFFLLKQFEDVLIYLNSIKVRFKTVKRPVFFKPLPLTMHVFFITNYVLFDVRVTSITMTLLISTTLKPKLRLEILKRLRRFVKIRHFRTFFHWDVSVWAYG